MAVKQQWKALLLAAALGACAELTAEAPLFSPADQAGPAPLVEGIWITLHEECPDSNARRRTGRFPADCTPIELRHTEDGAWQARLRVDLVYGLTAVERADAEEDAGPYRLIIAPAVERSIDDAHAPIYLAETTRPGMSGVGYLVIAPLGEKPAAAALLVLSVGCADILRDGPVEGIAVEERVRNDEQGVEHRDIAGCTATTQAAVREAARRAVIENLDEMLERRFVYVRSD